MDGLEAEREQNITIDVGYHYFATTARSFIVADAPGHEQFTRNMATGASNCELAVILVDASKGVAVQTRRHAIICSLLGIRHIVLAVNKMDLIGYDRSGFDHIVSQFDDITQRLSFASATSIPLSARFGDNVNTPSRHMAWYRGPTLLEILETIDVESDVRGKPFRFPVQWVNRPNADFRGLAGTVVSGTIRRGERLAVVGRDTSSTVSRIVTADGDLDVAVAGEAVTLSLSDELDIARGDLLASPGEMPEVADQFAAHVLWMSGEPLLPGRSYLMRIGTRWVQTTISMIKHKLDVNHFEPLAARSLTLNEIGFCNLSAAVPVSFDPYADNRATGAFILVDRYNDQTVAAGMIVFALHRATNIHREQLAVGKSARARLKNQRSCILWFTGLPASGKSTIARLVEARLHAAGHHTYMLDGDNVRHGLTRDLGFTDVDRVENIRRVGEVAKLFVDAGVITICAFISPFAAERQSVRDLVEPGEFIEIFVDTLLEECQRRDPKGLYEKARSGTIKNFTGIDSAYEVPVNAELVLPTQQDTAERLAERVTDYLRASGHIA
jgi:bifunctional enzyme CysN/CysC